MSQADLRAQLPTPLYAQCPKCESYVEIVESDGKTKLAPHASTHHNSTAHEGAWTVTCAIHLNKVCTWSCAEVTFVGPIASRS